MRDENVLSEITKSWKEVERVDENIFTTVGKPSKDNERAVRILLCFFHRATTPGKCPSGAGHYRDSHTRRRGVFSTSS